MKAVSYPNSPEYGKYLNFAKIARHVHGRPESVQALVSALEFFGVSRSEVDFTLGMDFAVTHLPVRVVEAMFSTKLHSYQHVDHRDWVTVKAIDYITPKTLRGHVDFVFGFAEFPSARRIRGRKLFRRIFSPKDLETFQSRFHLPIKPVVKVIGVNDPTNPGIEANLDVQYISALGRNVPTWFISVSATANGGQEDFLSWIVAEVNRTNSPWVHSVSYGDYEQSVPNDYQLRVDVEFMKFGISGRTVLIASGDEGAHCQKEQTPDYQLSTVQAYLMSGEMPPRSYFNASGRAYPDVSAFATNFEIVVNGSILLVDGTSCSTPVFAGIVSLLNDIRLNAGKSTVGFLNPLLYQTLKDRGFIDINAGANIGDVSSCPGFKATKGWDPASGWGSPDFSVLKKLVLRP
ncbi:hypothetical protein EMCRGX_G016127 [Ephydatia muelleri]